MAQARAPRRLRAIEEQKGVPSGLASLDADARVPVEQLPMASNLSAGVVLLSDDVTLGLSNVAASGLAAKTLYDMAVNVAAVAQSLPAATLTSVGTVRLSDSVDSADTTVAATANAVRATYEIASSALVNALAAQESVNVAMSSSFLAFEAANSAVASAALALEAANAAASTVVDSGAANAAYVTAVAASSLANSAFVLANAASNTYNEFVEPFTVAQPSFELDVFGNTRTVEYQFPPMNMTSSTVTYTAGTYFDGAYISSASVNSTSARLAFDGTVSSTNGWVTTATYSTTAPYDYTGATRTLTAANGNVAGEWIQIQFPTDIKVRRLEIVSGNLSTVPNQMLGDLIDFYVSTTAASGSWVYAASSTSAQVGTDYVVVSVPESVPAARYVRAIIRSAANERGSVSVTEFKIFGLPTSYPLQAVGIRKPIPRYAMDVGGGIRAEYLTTGLMCVNAATTTTTFPALTVNQRGTGDILNVQDNGSTVFVVRDGGNVGIGTTAPASKFEVRNGNVAIDTISSGYALAIGNSTNGVPAGMYSDVRPGNNLLEGCINGVPRFVIGGTDGQVFMGQDYVSVPSNARCTIQENAASTNNGLSIHCAGTGVPIRVFGGTGPLAAFQGTGNVSISSTTITPTAKLDVDGDVVVRGRLKTEMFLVLPLSDFVTSLTAANGVLSYPLPDGITLTKVPRITLGTASSSGLVEVDIKVNGTSIFGATKLSIDAAEKTSATAAAVPTLASTAFADGAELTVDLLQAGTDAKGLVLTLFYKLT